MMNNTPPPSESDRLLHELQREEIREKLFRLVPWLGGTALLLLVAVGVQTYREQAQRQQAQQAAADFEAGRPATQAPYVALSAARSAETAAPADAGRLLREAADAAGDPVLREVFLLKAAVRALDENPAAVEPILTDVTRLTAQADELRMLAFLRLGNRAAADAARDRALASPLLSATAKRRLQAL